jgi:hypothetical protein
MREKKQNPKKKKKNQLKPLQTHWTTHHKINHQNKQTNPFFSPYKKESLGYEAVSKLCFFVIQM